MESIPTDDAREALPENGRKRLFPSFGDLNEEPTGSVSELLSVALKIGDASGRGGIPGAESVSVNVAPKDTCELRCEYDHQSVP